MNTLLLAIALALIADTTALYYFSNVDLLVDGGSDPIPVYSNDTSGYSSYLVDQTKPLDRINSTVKYVQTINGYVNKILFLKQVQINVLISTQLNFIGLLCKATKLFRTRRN